MIVPYGAHSGFSLRNDIREVAIHYGVQPRTLRRRDGRHGELCTHARHALFWKLHHSRKLSPERIAGLMRCSARAVRDGIAAHAQRITDFQVEGIAG